MSFSKIFDIEQKDRSQSEEFKPHNVRVIRAANPVCRRMTERGEVFNPKSSIFRDQPIPRASPLRINTLLSRVLNLRACSNGECGPLKVGEYMGQ